MCSWCGCLCVYVLNFRLSDGLCLCWRLLRQCNEHASVVCVCVFVCACNSRLRGWLCLCLCSFHLCDEHVFVVRLCVSVRLSGCLSVCLSICLSVCLSVLYWRCGQLLTWCVGILYATQQVLLWATVVFVLIGGIVLLGYNLLPPGSFSRAWRGDEETVGDEEDGKWTRAQYAAPNQGINYSSQMRQV